MAGHPAATPPTLQIGPETLRWRSREVDYYAGAWDEVLSVLPAFQTEPFRAAPEATPNPHLQVVTRKPLSALDGPMPVGVVSHRYALVQHRDLAKRCREGLLRAGVDPAHLSYEVGVSHLGEWMNLRIYCPPEYGRLDAHGERVDLRLESFNAVDGSSRLIVLFGWFRRVCANGMVIGESRIEIRERHEHPLALDTIPERIAPSLRAVEADRRKLEGWERTHVDIRSLAPWVDGPVAERWGKRAAARVFHICVEGYDVDPDSFAKGTPSQKPVELRHRVEGSPAPARTQYDVSQALSWVATDRKDAVERLSRQGDIPGLLKKLPIA